MHSQMYRAPRLAVCEGLKVCTVHQGCNWRGTTYGPCSTYLNLRSQVKLALCIFVQFTSCGKFLSKGDCM